MFDKKRKEFIADLNSVPGKRILASLYDEFVKTSAFDENTNALVYKMAKKELVLGLIQESNISIQELDEQYTDDYEDNIYD